MGEITTDFKISSPSPHICRKQDLKIYDEKISISFLLKRRNLSGPTELLRKPAKISLTKNVRVTNFLCDIVRYLYFCCGGGCQNQGCICTNRESHRIELFVIPCFISNYFGLHILKSFPILHYTLQFASISISLSPCICCVNLFVYCEGICL